MRRLLALMMFAVSLGAAAQITYPYNPDEDGNGQIAVGDLQGILATYGNAFTPSEILVDGETLTTVLTQLQNSIDSLSSLAGGGGSVLDMPLGTVLPIATESVPEGWMLCDGREISIEEYHGLYDLIGTTYGAGDSAFWAQVFYPATTFNIPDLRGRTIIGANDMGGEQSEVIVNHSAQRGQSGGAEMHQLVESELPVVSFPVLSFQPAGPDLVNNGSTPVAETQFQFGADEPHNNMQPYMALNYMIKVQLVDDVVAALQNTIVTQQSQIDSLSSLMAMLYDFVYYSGCGSQTSVNYLGHEYPLVDLGDQCWLGENLSVDVFRNGDAIPFLGTNGDVLNGYDGTGVGGYTYPAGDPALAHQGFLYNGYVVIDDRAICPIGFRLPTYEEFNVLRERILDSPEQFADNEDWYGTNETGFSAVPSGRFENDFNTVGTSMWMYGRQTGSTEVTVLTMNDWNGESQGGYTATVFTPWTEQAFSHGRIYWSIRCIKDAE